MISDFITFITALPAQIMQRGDFLPESFDTGSTYLNTINNYIEEINTIYKIVGSIVMLAAALIGCFFGYKLCKLFMALTGLLIGAIAGGVIGVKLLEFTDFKLALCVLIGALLLSFLAYRIYLAGIFILCFALSFMAAASFLPFTGDIQFFLSVLAGFIVGSLALRFIRPVIIIMSALVCGFTAAGLLITVCEYMHVYTFSSFPEEIIAIVICALGILVQFLTTSAGKHEN
ncbi:MAG: FUSC family protein [Clostridiales bacterium]|nr:FUSC family protein [Clostridiales bacterium]